jgi:hypothetical protein
VIKVPCSRCGRKILVPNYFDVGDDVGLCPECEEDLDRQWRETHNRPEVEDTDPL